MSQKLRQEQILYILQKEGYVTVKYLTEALHYSSATINRDLNAMQTLGLVKRSYGGVEVATRKKLPPLPLRQFYMKKEKRRNAEAAAKLIENGETVFLDGSTSVEYMMPYLAEKKELTVITNSLRLAIELGERDIDVICLGGRILERPHVLFGNETIENIAHYQFDKAFFSIDRITSDGSIIGGEYSYLIHRTMIKNSKETYLLTDRTKLCDRLEYVLCDFSALTGVISDFEFPEETKKLYPNVKFICTK